MEKRDLDSRGRRRSRGGGVDDRIDGMKCPDVKEEGRGSEIYRYFLLNINTNKPSRHPRTLHLSVYSPIFFVLLSKPIGCQLCIYIPRLLALTSDRVAVTGGC